MGQRGAELCRTQSLDLCEDQMGSCSPGSLRRQNPGDRSPKVSCKRNLENRPGQERGHQRDGQNFSMELQRKPQTPDLQITSVSPSTRDQPALPSGLLSLGTQWATIRQLSSLFLHVAVCHLWGFRASRAHPRWVSPFVPSPSVPLF